MRKSRTGISRLTRTSPGVLNVDLHSLWPPQQELMLATPPEDDGVGQWVTYDVAADGKSLAHGETGTWVLGAADVDVRVGDAKQITLQVSANGGKKKTLFWVNPRFVGADGKEIAAEAATDFTNIDQPRIPGRNYEGGQVVVAGVIPTAAWPTQPKDGTSPAILHINAPAGAVRFRAMLGGNYTPGNPRQPRKVFVSRVHGTTAAFLTLIEPYEAKAVVTSATATSADGLRVELSDGRVQEIHIHDLAGSADRIGVSIRETKSGSPARDEQAGPTIG